MKNYNFTLAHAGSTPTSLELTHSPIGWNDKTITFTRNETYHSVMRSYSLSLKFIREAKAYIDAAYEADGINALITITVTQLNKADYTYDAYYTGILDLSKYVKRRDDTECPIIDSDRLSKFKSRDEIELSLNTLKTLDDVSITDFASGLTKNFTIEGVDISQLLYVEFISNAANLPNDSVAASGVAIIEEIDFSSQRYTNNSGASQTVKYTVECTINWDFTFDLGGGIVTLTAVISENGTDYTIATIEISSSTASNEVGTFTDSREVTSLTLANTAYVGDITLNVVTSLGDPATGTVDILDGTLFFFNIEPGVADTTPQILLPDEAVQRCIQQMTGDTSFRSNLIGRTDSDNYTYSSDGSLGLIGIANGANIRGFSQLGRPFKTSFKDLFRALYSINPIGFWYSHANSRWELEDIESFYKTATVLALGEVKNLEISVDESYYKNSIIASHGQKLEYENEKTNMSQNICTKTLYSNDIQRVQNEDNISTDYRTDDFGIELTRKMNFLEHFSADVKADEDNFMIYGQRSGSNFITVQGYDDFETITSGTEYYNIMYSPDTRLNLDLSPKRCMLRHTKVLNIPIWKTEADIRFISSQYNFNLGLQKTGEPSVIYESDDIVFVTEPLYYPEIYNFELKITTAILSQLYSDPHIMYSFTHLGTTYYGHLIEISTEPFNRKGNCTLIRVNPNRIP